MERNSRQTSSTNTATAAVIELIAVQADKRILYDALRELLPVLPLTHIDALWDDVRRLSAKDCDSDTLDFVHFFTSTALQTRATEQNGIVGSESLLFFTRRFAEEAESDAKKRKKSSGQYGIDLLWQLVVDEVSVSPYALTSLQVTRICARCRLIALGAGSVGAAGVRAGATVDYESLCQVLVDTSRCWQRFASTQRSSAFVL